MSLVSTNLKADPDKVELAKLKGINLSKLFRDALDTSLRVSGDDREMLENQLTEIEKQIEILELEKKLVLDQLKTMESVEELESYRVGKFNQWKTNIAYQIKHNTIDWAISKKLFRFPSESACKTWLTQQLKSENLI